MPKPRNKEEIVCQYFRWLLGRRGDVYFADGRSNNPPLGRQTLGTKDRTEALESLKQLDLVAAVQAGRADKTLLDQAPADQLGLEEGWKRYLQHVARPRVTGGAGASTVKRYKPVGDKFLPFARTEGINAWNQVRSQTLNAYAAHLELKNSAYSTQYLELNVIKQAVKWFIQEELLPTTCSLVLPLQKSHESDTYCWTAAEVAAMIDFCRKARKLDWLGDVVVGLACTGLRISELVGLRWADVDLAKNMITLTDESTRAPTKSRRTARIMKSKRSRSFPIQADLRDLLQRLPRAADGYVFRGLAGSRITADNVRRILVQYVLTPLTEKFPTAEGEIGFEHGRLHSFRHYFCSICANQGVPERTLMVWLGHSSSAMIKRYYHLHDAEAQSQMQKLNPILQPTKSKKRSAG
jgi:integrase